MGNGTNVLLGNMLRKMAEDGGSSFTPPLLIGVKEELGAEMVAESLQSEYNWHDQSEFEVIGKTTIAGPIAMDKDLGELADDTRIVSVEVDGYGHQLDE